LTTANHYQFMLSSVPSWIGAAVVISPATNLHASIAQSIRDYMDERGPFELYDSSADWRFSRCSRFPDPREEKPWRVGAEIVTRVIDALSGAAGDGDLPYNIGVVYTPTTPAPSMYFLGKVGVYPLV
jgi:hypothetical protein